MGSYRAALLKQGYSVLGGADSSEMGFLLRLMCHLPASPGHGQADVCSCHGLCVCVRSKCENWENSGLGKAWTTVFWLQRTSGELPKVAC